MGELEVSDERPNDETGAEGTGGVVGDLAAAMLRHVPQAEKWLRDPETADVVADHLAAFLDGVGRGMDGVEQPAKTIGNDNAVQVRQLGVACDLATALWADKAGVVALVGDEDLAERVLVRVGGFLGGVVTGLRVERELRDEPPAAGGGA